MNRWRMAAAAVGITLALVSVLGFALFSQFHAEARQQHRLNVAAISRAIHYTSYVAATVPNEPMVAPEAIVEALTWASQEIFIRTLSVSAALDVLLVETSRHDPAVRRYLQAKYRG
jgi:hypothetical protein